MINMDVHLIKLFKKQQRVYRKVSTVATPGGRKGIVFGQEHMESIYENHKNLPARAREVVKGWSNYSN